MRRFTSAAAGIGIFALAFAGAPAHARTDAENLKLGFQAADRADWDATLAFADQMDDSVAGKILYWHYYVSEDAAPAFSEISRFIEANATWPRMGALLERAERAMPDAMPADQVVAWFGKHPPVSGEGKIKLGQAWIARGDRSQGERLIQEGWIQGDFTVGREQQILARHRKLLTAEINKQRADRLLWEQQYGAAMRLFENLDAGSQAAMQARMKLMANTRGADALLSRVPSSMHNDPALLYARAKWHRLQGSDGEARPLILRAPGDAGGLGSSQWWAERNLLAREALDLGMYEQAYKIVSQHGLKEGLDFAEAEFLAGWIALRYLHEPARAIGHFTKLKAGVTYPISLARASYWLGRAADEKKDKTAALAYYRDAARYPETFYGQLAMLELDETAKLSIDDHKIGVTQARTAFNSAEMTRAIRLLSTADARQTLRIFALHYAEIAQDKETYALLSSLLRDLGHPGLAVRVAKRAMQKQIPAVAYAYPLVDLPELSGAPEKALVLGLSRQESEFDPDVISPAGARGMMQLMPETARRTARAHGMKYHGDRLITDADYNMKIGMAHLSDLLNNYDGSYILTIAAYNAGGGRVSEWVNALGDPRNAGIDPIDWIERIPFNETRNYVQRVLENTQIYRVRLAHKPVELKLGRDLGRRGARGADAAPVMLVPEPVPSPRRVRLASASD